ncbi:MAG: DUF1043 family protein [Gammaproteobacteria bacterium]|nr:DUF1043 family protein [Gammaproteobacteria bacterium]
MLDVIFIILAVAVGIAAGYVLRTFLSDTEQRIRSLTQELEQSKAAFRQYQLQVSDHLLKSADILNNLQQNCQSLQDHVLTSAQTLNLDSNKQSVLQPHSHYIQYEDTEMEMDNDVPATDSTVMPRNY